MQRVKHRAGNHLLTQRSFDIRMRKYIHRGSKLEIGKLLFANSACFPFVYHRYAHRFESVGNRGSFAIVQSCNRFADDQRFKMPPANFF